MSAASIGVVSATNTLNCSELPFWTDEKSGRKLKLPLPGLSMSFPPPLGSLTTVKVTGCPLIVVDPLFVPVMTPFTRVICGSYVIESAGASSEWEVIESTPSCRREAPKSIHDNGESGVGVSGEFPANGLTTSPSTAAKTLGAPTVVAVVVAGAAVIVGSEPCPVRKRGGVHSDVWV